MQLRCLCVLGDGCANAARFYNLTVAAGADRKLLMVKAQRLVCLTGLLLVTMDLGCGKNRAKPKLVSTPSKKVVPAQAASPSPQVSAKLGAESSSASTHQAKQAISRGEKPSSPAAAPSGVVEARNSNKRSVKLVGETLSKKQRLALQKQTLRIFETSYRAEKYCPPDVVIQADSLSIYSIPGRPDYRVVLCTGSLDGESNVVSVFSRQKGRKSKTVWPISSTYRISNAKLADTAKSLLAKF